MRYPSAFNRRDGSLDVAMTPMIDVVFMLLIFFVWTASFQVAELILPSSLITQNEGQGSQPLDLEMEDLERVVVRMTLMSQGLAWEVNDVPIASLSDVRARLATVAKIKNTIPVLVDPAALVPLGDVIDVYDSAKVAGFQNVQFATPIE